VVLLVLSTIPILVDNGWRAHRERFKLAAAARHVPVAAWIQLQSRWRRFQDMIQSQQNFYGISSTRERRTASSSVAAENEATKPNHGKARTRVKICIKIFMALVAVEHSGSVTGPFGCIDAAGAPFDHHILKSEDGLPPSKSFLGMV
jgi:hypothetical protein